MAEKKTKTKKVSDTRMKPVCIMIDKELRQSAEKAAEKQDRNLSSFIRLAIKNFIKKSK